MFVQVQQKWRRMYAGECQGPGVRTDFEMVHLRRVPSQYTRLSGLLDIFKSKIVSALKWVAFTMKVDSKPQLLLTAPGWTLSCPPHANRIWKMCKKCSRITYSLCLNSFIISAIILAVTYIYTCCAQNLFGVLLFNMTIPEMQNTFLLKLMTFS